MTARRFRPYPAYKDSGVEWLGEIPAGWEVKRIRDIAEALQTGPFGSQLHSDEYITGGFPVINPTNLRDGGLVPDVECTVDGTTADRLVHHRLHDGDILFARRGELGRCGLVSKHEQGWLCGTGCLRLQVHFEAARPNFLMRLLSTSGVADWLGLQSVGATMQNLNTSIIGRIPIVIPPVEEQDAIAAFLERKTVRIDALVVKKERLIDLLQEKRTALITRAVTKGLDPNVPMKDTGVEWLGEIPAHWDASKMWQISSAISGGTPTKEDPRYWGGEIPWVSPKDMKRRHIDSSEDTITDQGLSETGLKLVSPPAVLIVVRGMILVHSFPVAVTEVPVTINQDMKALRLRRDIEPLFIAWVFEGVGKALVAAIVEEAAHGTRVIRMDEWRTVTVPVPPKSEQQAIVSCLDRETARLDALITKIREAIDRLKELRTALISAAVTGKIDVRETDGSRNGNSALDTQMGTH